MEQTEIGFEFEDALEVSALLTAVLVAAKEGRDHNDLLVGDLPLVKLLPHYMASMGMYICAIKELAAERGTDDLTVHQSIMRDIMWVTNEQEEETR